jgi:hypothetical protein
LPDKNSRRDAISSIGVGTIALVVYVRTLAPGLTSDVDTAMFQFVGRVLGVAHNPGYPLYVLLTHAFSYVPIGSLAYRINLFSAILGALTVSLAFLIARRLGCRRAIAAGACLGLAFGHVFWSQSVIAEVYTLNAALVSGLVLSLLVWKETRRPVWYFLAVMLLSAGLGNHTTILGFAPGVALFVLLTDARFAVRSRTMLATAALVLAGLLQYGFILVRSRQPDVYVESRATSLKELVGVMLGGQFQERLFAFGAHALVTERLPWLLKAILVPELTIVGVMLAILGAAWLLRHRLCEAGLLLTGAAAVFAFALNYAVNDTPVFLVPTILVLWLLAALGAEWISSSRWRGAGVLATLACFVLPIRLLATNFRVDDRSRDTREDVQLERLLDALPERSALVKEDFLVDRMVTAKLLGDGPAHNRRIPLTPPHVSAVRSQLDAGAPVFAFGKSAAQLRFEGADVSFAPLRLLEGPLEAFLRRLPDDVVIALAVPAAHSAAFAVSEGASLHAVGGPSTLVGIAPASIVCVGARGRRSALLRSARLGVSASVSAGGAIGETRLASPADIEVRADGVEASVRFGPRELVRTMDGVALAAWKPDGGLVATVVLQAEDGYQVPMQATPLSAYRLGKPVPPTVVDREWRDVTGAFQTASAMVHVPSGRRLVLYFGDDTTLAPRVVEATGAPRVTVSAATSVNAFPRPELEAGAEALRALQRDTHLYRFEISASHDPSAVFVATGGVPAHVAGQLVGEAGDGPADVVAVNTRGLLRSPDRRSEVLQMGRDAQSQLTGDGWSRVDWDSVGPFRWLIASEGRLLLPVTQPGVVRVRVQALQDDRSPATTMALSVNGAVLAEQQLTRGWHVYEWALPPSALSIGTNEVCVLVDRLTQDPASPVGGRGVAVSDVQLIHAGS